MEPETETRATPSLTQVTPFSKTLALVLLVALPILALYVGYTYGSGEQVLPTAHTNVPEQADFQKTKLSAQLPDVAYGIKRPFTSPEETYPMKIVGYGRVLDSASIPATVPSITENGFFGDAAVIVFEMEEMDASVLQEKIAKNSLPENILSFEDIKGKQVYVACAALSLNLKNTQIETGAILAVPELGSLCNPWTMAVEGANGQTFLVAGNAAN